MTEYERAKLEALRQIDISLTQIRNKLMGVVMFLAFIFGVLLVSFSIDHP